MTCLLEGNVLVALRLDSHVHHDRVHRWFAGLKREHFATCVMTQGTLLRVHMKTAADASASAAWQALREIQAHPRRIWWGDGVNFLSVPHRQLQGHSQITDAWLNSPADEKAGLPLWIPGWPCVIPMWLF